MKTGFRVGVGQTDYDSDFGDLFIPKSAFSYGGLWLWGRNSYGQLGDNTITNKSSPVQTVTFGTNWRQIAVGFGHSSAIKTDGTLWLWGDNSSGQLGNNTTTSRSSPVQTIAYGTNWRQIAVGFGHSSAIKSDGTLWVWGSNIFGQLGDNTTTGKSSPVQTVAYGNNWKQASAGSNHTAAIKTDGTLWLWGFNNYGQLGDNTTTGKSSPVQTVTFGNNWKYISLGSRHSAAIKTDGTLWTWGDNTDGQLGDNTTTKKSSPVQTVAYGTNWKTVSASMYANRTSSIKTDNTLWSWGTNTYGQLGDNTTTNKSSPVQTVAFGTNWKQVSTGAFDTSAIKIDGTLWLWGRNNSGQLGDNTTTNKSSPVQTVAFGTNWKLVSSGVYLTSAIKDD